MSTLPNLPARRGLDLIADQLTGLVAELAGVRLVMVLRFHGLNGPKALEIRRWTWENGARFRVVGNRLAAAALQQAGIEGIDGALAGSCALLLARAEPDRVLLGFERYLAKGFPTIIKRKQAGPHRIRAGMGGRHAAYFSGFRSNPNQLHIAAVWLDGEVLCEGDRAVLREAGGVAGLQGRLLGDLLMPSRRLLWLLAARAAELESPQNPTA